MLMLRIEMFAELREIAWRLPSALVALQESARPDRPARASRDAMRCTLPTRDSRSFDCTSDAETPRLFSTLPTLCSTPVATSAMPASREASRSCDCSSRWRSSCSTSSVTSQDTPRIRTGSPRSSQKIRACACKMNGVARRRDDAKAEGADIPAFRRPPCEPHRT